jgi:cell pole-organizing protein PopZ
MNAPSSLSQDQKSAERKAYEPSMEEILASIRRIIADDQTGTSRPATPKEATEPRAFDSPPAPTGMPGPGFDPPAEALPKSPFAAQIEAAFAGITTEKADPTLERDIAAQRMPQPKAGAPESESARPVGGHIRREADRRHAVPAAQVMPGEDPLISPQTDAAVSAAFNTLVASRFLQSNALVDDAIHDLLRPMLKAWLDDNLPILVERLVRAEIERVARGAR